MRFLAAAVLVMSVVASCGDDGASVATIGDSPDESDPRYITTTVVLESPDHGPQLCLGGVAESYPPQCGGPDVHGWEWGEVESAAGTRWGTYTVVGTWDGEALTLTEPPSRPDPSDPTGSSGEHEDGSVTPCEPPEGGWRPVDEATTSDEAMQAAIEYASSQEGVGGVWLDQSVDPAAERDPVDEAAMNDPATLVLNVSFTDRLEQHEVAIRERWGGALCVSEAPVAAAGLQELATEVVAEIGEDHLFSSADEMRGTVVVGVPVDDGLQERLDERYGPGAVEVRAQLRPVED